jgi:hypothetical protein
LSYKFLPRFWQFDGSYFLDTTAILDGTSIDLKRAALTQKSATIEQLVE